MSIFSELKRLSSPLATPGCDAVEHIKQSPLQALQNLDLQVALLTRAILAFEGLDEPAAGTQIARLNLLNNRGFFPTPLMPFFHSLAKNNEEPNIPDVSLRMTAKLHLKIAEHISKWFIKSYGPCLPPSIVSAQNIDTVLQDIRTYIKDDSVRRSARKSAISRASTMILSEEETRVIIDYQLNTAGWVADTLSLRYSQGTRPEKNVNKAIAEWPTDTGPADYALFAGLDLIGFIEAKKMGRAVVSDLTQGKRYARSPQLDNEARFIARPWNDFKVPFLFSTNGRPYLEQIKEKSGIWFLDVRHPNNHPRPLQGWYTAEELRALLEQDIPAAHAKLTQEPMDYLGLRDYQEKAIRHIEAALNQGQTKLLVAMATGTGKTRLAIGLIYRLIKSKRFRRILFIVDRNALGEQAGDKFKETRLEELKTFEQIYDLKEVDTNSIEPTTKVKIATVQALMHAIMYPSDPGNIPSVGQYDCIIVDEAHRGYTLDRELGKDELLYRDQNDYLSKFRRVIEYFDAVKIGMTATPAPHTTDIFGMPVYTYSYREAVIDDWLVDHEPPHQLVTRLSKDGIKWKKGDTIPVYDPATGEITNIENIPDEVNIEVDKFNKLVITENFNRTVAKELIKHLNPDGEEKTLIFAATDDHADTVVRVLKEEFEAAGIPIPDEAIAKITGSIDRPEGAIRQYKNERLPNIAVTVDLMTTGIDVPEICNLVFIRRIRSRILFEQMLGRATRRCDRIGKDHFNIFDAVSIYEALEPVSAMKPVSANPNDTLGQLFDGLDHLSENKADKVMLKKQVEQILAKLRRILRRMDDETLDEFTTLSGGQTMQQFIASLKVDNPEDCCRMFAAKRNLLAYLDENRHRAKIQLISHHEDELESYTRGYGNAKKPEDYLNAFRDFIITNMNKVPALAVVCQRPRELTRQTLKELKLVLDEAGFTERNLQVAWKDWKNEDIAADIISFIRRQALGDPLVSHEERIGNAMKRIYAMSTWTAIQRQWLERIEKQLIAQTVLDREDFDRGAFAQYGGFSRLNKIFQGNFQDVLDKINTTLYASERQTA